MRRIVIQDDFDLHVSWRFPQARRFAFAFASLAVVLLAIYSNSFDGEWHFDDFDNIVWNQNVHIRAWTWEALDRCLHGMDHPHWIRPLSYLSFALNHQAGGLDVFGYHLVNVLLHGLTSCLLFLFVLQILHLPQLRSRYGESAYSIALLASFFWALHPLHVSTVSYLVQRMAILAGLFHLLAMLLYVVGRTERRPFPAAASYVLCAVAALLGFAAKENTAMLPWNLFLLEILLMQGIGRHSLRKTLFLGGLAGLAVVAIGLTFTGFVSPIGDYEEIRPFTLGQRLLTQPRVFLLYLSLLLYPANGRLALLHDLPFSASLWQPWTTLPALLAVLGLLAVAVLAGRKRPLVAFVLLFFFFNHLIEGSVISLELAYEHRNYLPSLLLFVPFATLFVRGLDALSGRPAHQVIAAGAVASALVFFGASTHARNEIFRTELTLWQDNVQKSPRLFRTHNNLGRALWKSGRHEEAFQAFGRADRISRLGRDANLRQAGVVQFNLGLYHLEIQKDPEAALPFFRRALEIYPAFPQTYTSLVKAHLLRGDLAQAEAAARQGAKALPRNPAVLRLQALVTLQRGAWEECVLLASALLKAHPNDMETLPVLAEAHRRLGRKREAIGFWERYAAVRTGSISARLALIELYDNAGQRSAFRRTLGRLACLQGERGWQDLLAAAAEPLSLVYRPEKEILLPLLRRAAATEPWP